MENAADAERRVALKTEIMASAENRAWQEWAGEWGIKLTKEEYLAQQAESRARSRRRTELAGKVVATIIVAAAFPFLLVSYLWDSWFNGGSK
jgi:hypothetical protein